jgi:hypothetical protein
MTQQIKIRKMTNEERSREGWDHSVCKHPICIELEDGTLLYPTDDDGEPGTLLGYDPSINKRFYITQDGIKKITNEE